MLDSIINSRGNVLQKSARQEFEQARYETDPMVVARLLLVGRDCLNQANEKVIATYSGR